VRSTVSARRSGPSPKDAFSAEDGESVEADAVFSEPPLSEAPPSELAAGSRVGRYLVDRPIGRGGMGIVYRARDPALNRAVAVKLLMARGISPAERERLRARLLQEAQAMARLSHPEVMPVYDVGAFGEQLFVAMECVDGETLRQWRAAAHRSLAEVLGVYERAGSGLAAAHEAGLVHRDFKPDNVLVGRDGRVRVTDFGLARVPHAAPAVVQPGADGADTAQLALTRTGTLLGTPAYMAPEQLRGGVADARSDVFSFCVALYEALYGERPFEGNNLAALRTAIEGGAVRSPPIITPVPRWLRTVLLRGLKATPDERFPSMRALLNALRNARASARHRLARAASAGAIAIAALGGFAILHGAGRAERVAPAGSPASAALTTKDDRGPAPAGEPPAVRFDSPPPTSREATPYASQDEAERAPLRAPRRAAAAPPAASVPASPAAPPANLASPASSAQAAAAGSAAPSWKVGHNAAPILP
jgi:hypothetical protein